MGESKHTPGPWRAEKDRRKWCVMSQYGRVCTISQWTSLVDQRDARLIAAAPDLLAALKCFLQDERFDVAVGGNPIAVDAMLKQARDAVSKAEGSDA